MKVCSVEGCEKKHEARGLCQSHYDKLPQRRAKSNARSNAHKANRRRTEPGFRTKENARLAARRAQRRTSDPEWANKDRARLVSYQAKRLKTDPAFRAKCNARSVARKARRLKIDPLYKLKHSIGVAVRKSFKHRRFKKESKTGEILGATYEGTKRHIEAKFKQGWTWENRGVLWDLDHIIPLDTAKTPEDIIRLWHHSNLQPLECSINRNVKRAQVNWKWGT